MATRLAPARVFAGLLLLWLLLVSRRPGDGPQKYRQEHPQTLDWKDRRPIGSIFLARDNTNWPSNPRGWFGSKLDVPLRSPAEFEARLMDYADRSIALLKRMNAQGMIVWDLEGQQFPHPDGSYVGDPTQLFRIAPEMELFADEFFRKFSSQGLRVGICIRPQEILFRSNGSFYHREFLLSSDAIFDSLDKKIQYARNRWSCSLFYIDSNFGPLNLGLYDAAIFERLQSRYPDSLLIPEHEDRLYFAYTAPYYDLKGREKWPGTRSLSREHSPVYPGAFSVINTADADLVRLRPELIQAVKRGDILLFRAWWRAPEFAAVFSIYREAIADGGPVAHSQTLALRAGSDALIDLLKTDFDLIYPRPLRLVSVTAPLYGSVRIENGKAHYFAPSNAVGDVRFEYTISDGYKTATAFVIVTVEN